MPDLKTFEVTAQVEEKKVLDISRLSDGDLNTIERVLERLVIESSESREDEEVIKRVHQEWLANNEPSRDFYDNWHIDAISEHFASLSFVAT